MRNWISNRWVRLAFRIIVGGLFLYAGILKLQEPQTFADNIAGFQILPDSLVNLLALGLPVFEILIGALVVLRIQLRIASFSAVILCAIFGIALGSALLRGLKIDCGCFGGGAPSVARMWLSLARDGLLGLGAAIVWAQSCKVLENQSI